MKQKRKGVTYGEIWEKQGEEYQFVQKKKTKAVGKKSVVAAGGGDFQYWRNDSFVQKNIFFRRRKKKRADNSADHVRRRLDRSASVGCGTSGCK